MPDAAPAPAPKAPTPAKQRTPAPAEPPRRAAEPELAGPAPLIGCPCGGGCPHCAAAARGRHARRDPHERQAHAVGARLAAAPLRPRRGADHGTADQAAAVHARAGSQMRPFLPAPPARAPPGARRPTIDPTPAPPGLDGQGSRLMQTERDRFEPGLGAGLSAVRVHSGPRAASLAADHRAHAFAHGSHIVLGAHAQRAPPGARSQVLAHELVHVGQQSARGPPALTPAPVGVQRLDEEDDAILPSFSDVVSFGERALETASELPGRAADVVLENASALVESVAPGLIDLLSGGITRRLTELFCSGLDSLVGSYFSVLGSIDFMGSIEETFRGLTAGVGGLKAALGATASEALGTLLEPLVDGLQAWGGPLIQAIQSVGELVNGLFSGLWEHIAVPALDFLGKVGGAIWDGFKWLVDLVWSGIQKIRSAAGIAWEWLSEQFDIDWGSSSDVLSGLGDFARETWTGFLEAIEPIRRPLEVAGGILLLLSPLGPIIVLSQVIPPLWEKVTWLWSNWNSEDILVRARALLTERVLPGIFDAIGTVIGGLAGATSWLAGLSTQLSEAMGTVLGAFGGARCLQAVTTYLTGVSTQFSRMAAWARSGFEGLAPAIQAVLEALTAILRPIFDFLVRLAMIAINPIQLPIVITAAVWLLCPDRLKPPVIAFVYDLLIALIEAFPELLLTLGPLASIVKAAVLGYLRHLRGGEGVTDAMRIEVSNKAANLVAGGGLEFMAGFALGLLEGVIDGIIDPFRLIFLLGKLLVTAGAAIGNALAPFALQALPGFEVEPVLHRIPREPATPAMTPGAPASARGPPLASFEPEPVSREPTDAELAACFSPQTLAEFPATSAEGDIDPDALEAEARAEAGTRGATVSGLGDLLGDAWDAIIAGAEQIGAAIAGALLRFMLKPDFELGRSLGFAAGFVAFQALIIYLSAGGYAALKAVEPGLRQLLVLLLRFLDLGGELFAVLGRALKPLKGPILAGLGAIRNFLNRFAFARALLEKIERLAARVFRFGDEAAGAVPAGAVREAAEETTERAGREAAEEAAERTTREAAEEAAERTTREAAEEGAERTGREAAERAPSTLKDDALKAAQLLEARAYARAIAEANDAVDAPVPLVIAQLYALVKPRYRWIDAFYARPRGPGHFRIVFTATPDHEVDPDYSPGPPLTEAELRGLFPGLRFTKNPQRALDFMNRLPLKDRDFLIQRLNALDPAERLVRLREIGELSDRVADVDTLAAALRSRRTGQVVEEGTEMSRHLQDVAPQALDEADEIALRQTVTWRVNEATVQASRAALKARMERAGLPRWAQGLEPWEWNPHHIVPVEHQGHAIFNILRETPAGWDHNLPLNGIPLPTDLAVARQAGLPVHQFTEELVTDPRALRDVQGHPIWNEYTKSRLDELYDDFLARGGTDTDQLRRDVLDMIDELRVTIEDSPWAVLY